MATAVNEHTGALISTKGKQSDAYRDNYDRIFRKKEQPPEPPVETKEEETPPVVETQVEETPPAETE
jgi:hypothetical protein